jgi:uncharacterized sulfatase
MYSKPNVLWVTLDSIRADRTTMAGYERDTTPNMARIADADDGTAFTECIAHGMWSLPSDASMLTGTYPAQHGTGLWNDVLPADIRTVPERFHDLGYHTAGLSHNGHFTEATGLSRGFDRFEWVTRSNLLETAGPRILLKYVGNLRSESGGYTAPLDHHRSDYISTEITERWLESFAGREEPFFMFVHMLGAHLPYVPPLTDRGEYTDDVDLSTEAAVEVAYDRSINYYREIAEGCDFDSNEKDAIDAMYDALVRYVDRKVGDLFRSLRSLDLGPTVFVVTADHGDLLGENGVMAHQYSLHDAIVNVPMVVHGLPSLAEPPDDALVQHTDLMRVLLVEAGADASDLDGMEGIDPRDETREFALSQRGNDTFETATEEARKHDPAFTPDRFHPGLLHAVRSSRHKLLRSDRGEELFALPDEATDAIDAEPAIAEAHRTFLDETLEAFDRFDSSVDRELSDAMRQQLEELGYVV